MEYRLFLHLPSLFTLPLHFLILEVRLLKSSYMVWESVIMFGSA